MDSVAKPKLLVIELWGLGDLVIGTPFLQAASEKFAVTLMAKPYGEDLRARLWPEVKVVPFVAPWTAFHHKYRLLSWPWKEIIRLRGLKTERFDVGISARWDPRDHFVLRALRANRRLGFPRLGSQVFLTDPLARPDPAAHRYEYWRSVGRALGLDLPARGTIPLPPQRVDGDVLIHTGAGQPVRVWPLERYRDLARRLRQQNYRVQVACDADQQRWWLEAGETGIATPRSVKELMALFDRAAAFIGNDSGPGHVAALCGVPTFTIFGPQRPEWFAPVHNAAEWVEGAPCRFKPCFDACRFPAPHCILNLQTDAVTLRVEQFVQRHVRQAAAPIRLTAPEPARFEPTRPVCTAAAAAPAARRVLHVNNTSDIYGASRSLVRMVRAIDRSRFQPLVVLPEDGPLKKLIEEQGVEVILHPRLTVITRPVFHSWKLLPFLLEWPLSALFLWRLIRRHAIQVVHTNTGVILSPALAALFAGVPHVWHIRDWFQEFRKFWPVLAWYITRSSNKVITASNAIATQFKQRDKVVVIHNGFSLDEFRVPKAKLRSEIQARYGLEGKFVVGCVGRIKLVRKGQETLLHSMAALKQRGLPVKALVVGAAAVGSESHLPQLQQLARDLKIDDSVVFTGELPDTRPAYSAMDVLAMTSMQPEPFGGVVMEAMSMGLPVIATSIGGSLEQVVEGVTGLFVPPGDSAALADAVEKLANDPKLRERMGAAGVDRIAKHFSLDEAIDRIESVFDEVSK